MAEDNEWSGELTGYEPDFVNISGVDTEPLWVERSEVAAIGTHGSTHALVVLRNSGIKLVAKDMHPNEVAQIVSGVGHGQDQSR